MSDSISLPEVGLGRGEVIRRLTEKKSGDPDYRAPRTWSLVYYLDEEHTQFIQEAYDLFFSENALNPLAFKSLKDMEHEVVRMTAGMLHGGPSSVGTMTSGGTESCLLAVKTWRDYARAKRRGGRRPEMIVADTAHVAWLKGGEYFDVEVVRVPVGPDMRLDPAEVEKKINRNTVLVVASAPDYPHGMIDPIRELGEVAVRHQVPLHVDSCLGGFLLPFLQEIGRPIPDFDFRVPGVCSISADVHKYGFAAKGASVILYRTMDYLEHQFFIDQNWPGGVFLSHGLLGTRPGGAIAAAWASMMAIGRDGYRELARKTIETTDALKKGISQIAGLEVIATPQASVLAFTSVERRLDIYAIGDQMEEKGWHIDRLQRPEGLHAMVTPRHARVLSQYLTDLQQSVETVRANPSLKRKGDAAMYGMISRIPIRRAIRAEVRKMARALYGPENRMP